MVLRPGASARLAVECNRERLTLLGENAKILVRLLVCHITIMVVVNSREVAKQ